VAGFDNDVVYGTNIDLSGAGGGRGGNATILTNGQLLIGTTALNAGGTHVNVGILTSPNGSITIGYNSPNITLQLPGGGQALETLSDDIGTLALPSPTNNIQLVGHVVEQGATKFSTTVQGTNLININPMSSARWIVDPLGFNGTHTTIASAITSATSGDTIFIMPGTYTENLTLKSGVNLTAYPCDGVNINSSSLINVGNVIISGKTTMTSAGYVVFSGITLKTNADYCLAVTGSAASNVLLTDCSIVGADHNPISFTSSSSSANIFVQYSNTTITNATFNLYDMTSPGSLSFYYCSEGQAGTAISNNSAGVLTQEYCNANTIMSTSNTGVLALIDTDFASNGNATIVTLAGTGTSTARFCGFGSGSSSAISIGTGTTLNLDNCNVNSSNTNAITGSGSLNYSGITFRGTSTTINTGTQLGGTLQGSKVGTATAGFLGEQISSSATAVSITTATAKTITSISLTAGIYDVSAVGTIVYGTNGTSFVLAISATNNTITGSEGNDYIVSNIATMTNFGGSVPQKRVSVTSTTTYYAVMQGTFTGTATANARLTATRVG